MLICVAVVYCHACVFASSVLMLCVIVAATEAASNICAIQVTACQLVIYTIKRYYFMLDNNSHVSWWIFTILLTMETGVNAR